MGALLAVVKVSEESAAVRTQLFPAVIVTRVKVATPALAVTLSVPPSVHPAVVVEIVTLSLFPVPEEFTLP
jgi:hypothetical protein